MSEKLQEVLVRFTSRKFLVTVGCVVLVLLDAKFNFLSDSQRVSLVIVAVGYLTAEGAADVVSRAKE